MTSGTIIISADSNLKKLAAPQKIRELLTHPQTQAILWVGGIVQIWWGNEVIEHFEPRPQSGPTGWVIHCVDATLGEIICLAVFVRPEDKIEALCAVQEAMPIGDHGLWLLGRYDTYATPHGH